jgi:HD superfamily phosphohydrolase YqeK
MAIVNTTVVWKPLEREVMLIGNELLRGFVQSSLQAAPAYFWTVPASTSGKYHPPCSRGPGGLVHHTRLVVYFVRELARGLGLEAWMDELTAAAILHDMYKNGDNPDDRTRGMAHWSAHGLHARGYIEARVLGGPVETAWGNNPEFCRQVNKVFELMARHMGPFGGTAPACVTREDFCLYIADYISSRKLVNITSLDE